MVKARTPWNERKCSICGQSGFGGFTGFMEHRRGHLDPIAEAIKLDTATKQAELQYSFYNSPKELRLDLGEYVIRVERKTPNK